MGERVAKQSPLIVAAAVVMALPFGWGLGLFAAYLIAGKDFGQLPAATVPLGILGSVGFSLLPIAQPMTRLKILTAGAILFIAFAWLTA